MLIHGKLTEQIIGAAIEVHRELGLGLLESAYLTCMAHELSLRGISFCMEEELPVTYKGVQIDCGYRLDMLVDEKVVVELKAISEMHPVFEAQLLTYMQISDCSVGLLINFHVPVLKNRIIRRVL